MRQDVGNVGIYLKVKRDIFILSKIINLNKK